MTAVKTPRAAVSASSGQRSPYTSPVFAKVPTTGADSLFTSLPSLARASYGGLQDSPNSGSSRDCGPSIPAVRTSADLLPYQAYLDLHAARRHSMDIHSLDRLSTRSVPAHHPVEPAQPSPADAFSLFSTSGGLGMDQARPLGRHSLDSSLLQAQALYGSRSFSDPWARPELPESLYTLPELERLYLSAPAAAPGHHGLPAEYLTISAAQS